MKLNSIEVIFCLYLCFRSGIFIFSMYIFVRFCFGRMIRSLFAMTKYIYLEGIRVYQRRTLFLYSCQNYLFTFDIFDEIHCILK